LRESESQKTSATKSVNLILLSARVIKQRASGTHSPDSGEGENKVDQSKPERGEQTLLYGVASLSEDG
jgi:hypothetical protein